MLRLKVVGRGEEPASQVEPGTAMGAPQQTKDVTKAYLLVQSIDEDGKPMQSPNGLTMRIPATDFGELSEFETGTIYELSQAAG